MPPRALLIVNAGASRAAGADAAAALTDAGIDSVPCAAPDAIAAGLAAGGIDRIVIGGGDGTLHRALPALVQAGLPLGILPLGTANDAARGLGIPPDLAGAARVIAAGATRAIDLGEVNGELFLNAASVGFSSALAARLTGPAKRRWGRLGYAVAAFGLLRAVRPFRAELVHDGARRRVRTLQVVVGSGRQHGGGITLSAEARPDDGVFHVYSLEFGQWWRLPLLLPWLWRGTQARWPEVRAFRTTALDLRTRRPRKINADGEIVGTTPAQFRLRPRALRVFVPEG